MKSDLTRLGILVGYIGVAIYATYVCGEWSVSSFVTCLLITGIITGFLGLIASVSERKEVKWGIFIIYVIAISAYLDSMEKLRFKKEQIDRARTVQIERYQSWYNLLNPYQKLQEDNKQLQRENSLLQQR